MRRSATALAALVLSIASPALLRAQAAGPDVALVYRLLDDGVLEVYPAAGAPRRAAVGEGLRDGDQVQTSRTSRAALRFVDDASVLRINPFSRVQLRRGTERATLVRTLEVEFGEVRARVNRRDGTEFRVATPAGVAAVKGTEFVVRVDSAGTTVVTLEGVVEFFNDAGRTDVAAGERASAASRSAAPVASRASPEELRDAGAVGGTEGEGEQGDAVWIEVLLQDGDGRVRTLMLQVPAGAVRGRTEGR